MKKLILLVCALLSFNVVANSSGSDPDADYDRLDGKGQSSKKVNVIEWEGNLEIHVYPKNSLTGLGLKIDRANKDKLVMVIEYQFTGSERLVRRAILGIELSDDFNVFKDSKALDYDKIVITDKAAESSWSKFSFSVPRQLYPVGHPKLGKKDEAQEKKQVKEKTDDKTENNEADLDQGFNF